MADAHWLMVMCLLSPTPLILPPPNFAFGETREGVSASREYSHTERAVKSELPGRIGDMGRTPRVSSVFFQQYSFQERPEEVPISKSLKWKTTCYMQKQLIEFYFRLAFQGN